MPLYHCFGMVIGNAACVASGAAAIYPAESFSPEAALAAVQAEGCTSLYGVPTMFIAELALPTWVVVVVCCAVLSCAVLCCAVHAVVVWVAVVKGSGCRLPLLVGLVWVGPPRVGCV